VDRLFSSCAIAFACLACLASARGGAVDSAIVAAMKLPEARNYSWVSTVEDNGRFYIIEGRTQRDGYTRVNMPMVSAIQRKIGRDHAEMHPAIFKGDMDCVIETPGGWKTPAELMALPTAGKTPPAPPGNGGTGAGGGIGPTPGKIRYSNLQLNLSHPHDEVGLIIGSHEAIQPEQDGVSGTLSEAGAKLLLVHPGQNEITPLRATGTFRLWIKRGELQKYEVRLTGTIAVNTGATRREVSLRQTATTELAKVNATSFEVPEEARRKLP
jgi:hypothetical protein